MAEPRQCSKSEATKGSLMQVELVSPDLLKFDPRNPRLPYAATPSALESIQSLSDEADVSELVQSISNSGWLDYEPLIVERNSNIVLEGNRRLAALRLIADSQLASSVGVKVPAALHPLARPETIRVAFVNDRSEARDFIGFKHVNGPHKWDSLAKARFAWEWLQEDQSVNVDVVARRLGDGHNTVARLVNGFTILHQAEELGFDIEKRTASRFAFSHLYTILARPNARDWLGLDTAINEALPANPVKAENRDNLLQLMTWLYGQGEDQRAVIRTQNPDLNKLTEILGNRTATRVLASERRLDVAYQRVENRSRRFAEMLFALQTQARDVLSAVGDYEHDPDIAEIAENVQRTVRSIVTSIDAADADFVSSTNED